MTDRKETAEVVVGDLVAVVGTGPGALALAADLAIHGRRITVTDHPDFADRLAVIDTQGGVRVGPSWRGEATVPVTTSQSIEASVVEAADVLVCVSPHMYEWFAEGVLKSARPGASVVVVGTGGGSLLFEAARRHHGNKGVIVGETNCLPHVARPAGPGGVSVIRKSGGVLIAAVDAASSTDLLDRYSDVWPFLEVAESVWETTLINFDAIDTVPTAIANAATIESRPGGMLLWGEGASPAIVRVIEAIDEELLSLRVALGHRDRRRYRDFLIAQGLAPNRGSLHEMIHAGVLQTSMRPTGTPTSLLERVEVDVPYSLVLAASLGDAIDVDTPAIDAVVTLAGVLAGRDFRVEGRDLANLGLARATLTALRAAVGLR